MDIQPCSLPIVCSHGDLGQTMGSELSSTHQSMLCSVQAGKSSHLSVPRTADVLHARADWRSPSSSSHISFPLLGWPRGTHRPCISPARSFLGHIFHCRILAIRICYRWTMLLPTM